MSCFNPNYVKHVLDPDTGGIYSQFIGPARYLDPTTFGSPLDLQTRGYYFTPVPCGKCYGCLADRSREWSIRLLLELEDMKNAIFVTLTYNNDHLPRTATGSPTLNVRDTQLFFKRLRKKFTGRKIRFFLCGEYGSNTHRPHYHAIIFGLDLIDFLDLRPVSSNELGQQVYTSPTFEKVWQNGFVSLGEVTFHSCNYVARYTLKKQFGRKDEYEDGRKPEFVVSSRRPGIGKEAAIRRLETGNTRFHIDGKDGVYEFSIPTSILKRLKETKELDNIDEICYDNARKAQEALEQNLLVSGLDFDEYLRRKSFDLGRKLRLLPERR